MAKEKNPAISVIIPMYNTEKYIEECLQNLLNQAFKNFEVIVVDDCSTDNSVAVVQKMIPAFDAQNIEITVATNKANSGCPGIPRNFGITIAKGKYVYFMDSDDFLSEDVLENLYNVAENFNADIVDSKIILEYRKIDGKFETVAKIMANSKRIENPTLETFDISKRIEGIINLEYSNSTVTKIFRREFLIDNDIKFPAMSLTEDFIFMFKCMVCAQNYVSIPFIGYFYRIYAESTSHMSRDIKISSLDLIEGIYCLNNFMQEQKFFVENPKYQYRVIDFFNQWFSDVIFKNTFFDKNLSAEEMYNFYRKKVFNLDAEKNIPLTAYLFVSANIYKLLVKNQFEEIAQLKKIIAELKGD